MNKENWQDVLKLPILEMRALSGGDTNKVYYVETKEQDYVLKLQRKAPQNFFEYEKQGLQLLEKTVKVPKVYQIGKNAEINYLLIEYISAYSFSQKEAGEELAHLHEQHADRFGFENDNFLGKLPQLNTWSDNWLDFFINQRLQPQIKRAKELGHWSKEREHACNQFIENFVNKWQGLEIKPSLLHGDFWNGNLFGDKNEQPIFIDPSVYYGNREIDLAISLLFGGFTEPFYQAYNYYYPLEKDWQLRVPFYQLYHLLMHLNSFGEAYGRPIDQIIGIV